MRISQYKQSDGSYVDENGFYYEEAEDLLMHQLGWCGCGNPESALAFIREALKATRDSHLEPDFDKATAIRSAVFPNYGIEMLVQYVFDEKKLTSHGGSVGNSWLSQDGMDLLADLEEISSGDEEEEL